MGFSSTARDSMIIGISKLYLRVKISTLNIQKKKKKRFNTGAYIFFFSLLLFLCFTEFHFQKIKW